MAAKKSGRTKSNAKKQPNKNTKASVNHSDDLSGAGLSLADQSRLNGKYEKFELMEERVKEVERVKRFIFANLMRTAVGMTKNAEKGTNSAGAKLLWDFAEIDKLPTGSEAQTQLVPASAEAGDAPAASAAVKDDDDPTKAVLSFYKKLGMTPPKLKPPKPVESMETDATLEQTT